MVRPGLSRGSQVSGACCWVIVATVLWSCSTRLQLVGATEAAPVEQCAAAGCTLNNAYALWNDRSTCKAASVIYPTTELEIVKAVADAVRSNRKIKVATSTSHSIPKLACPGSPSGVILSTKKYTSIVNIDRKRRTVTAQSGILLRSLVDAIAGQGLALPVSPYWDGVTLAGLLGTSSHGSSLFGKGGAVHEYVTGMRLVTPASAAKGYAQIKVLSKGDENLNAAKVSLGVLGVISTITLQLQPAFKRSVTLEIVNGDQGLEDKILQIAQNEEFGDITWYPSLGQVVYRHDHRVPLNTPGEGRNNYLGFQPAPVSSLARAAVELADATGNRQLKCNLAFGTTSAMQQLGYGFFKNGIAYGGFPVIGHQHLIQTAGGCQRSPVPGLYCAWDPRVPGLVFNEAGAALPLKNVRSFITDVVALRSAVPKSLCDLDLFTGILIRFAKKSSGAYLGTAQADSAMIDFAWSRGSDPKAPRLDQDVFQELEQILFDKYGATPHWGKNRNYVFEGVAKKYRNLNRFLDVKNRFDPTGLFSSEWSDALLGLNIKRGAPGVSIYQPYCAIEGLCRCTKDEHCAPEKNSFCRPGRVYPAARVCRTEPAAT